MMGRAMPRASAGERGVAFALRRAGERRAWVPISLFATGGSFSLFGAVGLQVHGQLVQYSTFRRSI